MRMQTWETELLQMLKVTTIGSHSQGASQVLGEVRHHLVNMFSWQLFPDGLQGDFQLISCLRLRLELMVLFHHASEMWQSSGSKSGELGGHLLFSMNPFACSQFCMTFKCWEMGVSWLKQIMLSFLQRVPIACNATAVLATSVSVRPSVCPSVTRWYCVETNEATIMWFSQSDSKIILVSGE